MRSGRRLWSFQLSVSLCCSAISFYSQWMQMIMRFSLRAVLSALYHRYVCLQVCCFSAIVLIFTFCVSVFQSIVVLNCLSRWDSNAGGWPPQISLLFWRALCETGIGVRFLLQPAFNILVCGSLTCTRDTGSEGWWILILSPFLHCNFVLSFRSTLLDPSLCGFPSFMLEFFVLASEFWFLCNGLDLYYSITNPFFSYNKRYKLKAKYLHSQNDY